MSEAYTIRPFETLADYHACVQLQNDTWGDGFSERVPPAILKVSQILGGVASGAYDAQGTLVGFVFGMTGVRDGEVVHWSDMLAVRPEARDTGLGTQLKAHQRDAVRSSGIGTMYWTFDPLQARNAYLNFAKLGIVVREYAEDMYGETDSPLHRGIGTDRFIALWLLDSERASTRLARALRRESLEPVDVDPEAIRVVLDADVGGRHPGPGEPVLSAVAERLSVTIPTDLLALMADDIELARRWRVATRAVLTHYLDGRYEVREMLRGDRTSRYLLVRRPG